MARQATAQEARQETQDRQVRGRRLDTNLSPALLNPGAGLTTRRTDRPIYCGAMAGRCFGYTEHPNSKDPSKTSHRFVGEFLGVKADGTVLNTSECYQIGRAHV